MKRVALIDKYDKGTNYAKLFPEVEIDLYHLSSQNKKKLLVADMDIEIDTEDYDFIILVGAEPTKKYCSGNVSTHQGYLVDEKYLPLIDPGMLIFKPDMKSAFDRSVSNILEYISGDKKQPIWRESIGVEDEQEALTILKEILDAPVGPVALDTETTALYSRKGTVLGISIANSITKGYYISADVVAEDCIEIIQAIINKHIIVFHNAKFDIHMLNYHFGLDFDLDNITNPDSFEDTLMLHYILDESTGSHGLKQLCIKYTDLGDYDRDLDQFKKDYCRLHKVKQADFTYDLIPFDIMYPYAAKDAMGTLELYTKFIDIVKNSRINKAYEMLKKGAKFLIKIEDNGVPFSKEKLLVTQTALDDEIFQLEQSIYKYPEISKLEETLEVKFNPNSVQHLRYLFYSMLNLPVHGKKTATGANSVDAEVLDYLSELHPIVEHISQIKKAKKIKSTYIDKVLMHLDWDGRLRTNYNLTTTTSGRLSSSGTLNMQQLPRDDKRVKSCITAPEGYSIVSQDLGTAEMYIAAVLSKDKNLMQVFIDKQKGIGADFHSSIAHMVFRLPCDAKEVKELYPIQRQAAKAISFGILYGSGPDKVANTVNSEGGNFTVQDANEAIEQYFAAFPKLKKWLSTNQQLIKKQGYIYSIFNRKRRLGNVFSKDRQTQGHEVRSGINFLVQSVASDINLLASIDIQQYINDRNLDVEIFGLVHDSILAIVNNNNLDEYLKIAQELTQQDFGCSIPGCPIAVDQEIGTDYSFKKDE